MQLSRVYPAIALCGLACLFTFPSRAQAQDQSPVAPVYSRSWVGNSFATGGSPGGKWVQNNVAAMWVAADGRCYTASGWDEAKREGGIYQNGQVIGTLANLHPSEGGSWGMGVSSITGDGTWIYVGINGALRRYKMDGGHAPFDGGIGNRKSEVQVVGGSGYLWGLSADPANGRIFATFRGEAIKAKDKTPASPAPPDEVVMIDIKTMKPLARWMLPRAGRCAVAADGTLWVIQEAESVGSTPSRILHFTADGEKLPQEIAGEPGFSPTALHFGGENILAVADNGPDQQIKIYDLAGEPKLTSTFGAKGGIYSGVAGESKPLKFCGLTGLGTDAEGNIYISQNRFGPHVNGAEGAGTNIESYRLVDGRRNWQVLGLEFVDGGDFVPGTDGSEMYSKYSRYQLDLDKTTPGTEWSYGAHIINPFKYPNDPRVLHLRDSWDWSTTSFVRVLEGRRFMFNTSMWGERLEIYRFNSATDGEIAIPSGFLKSGGGGLTNAPEKGEWLWRDLNGNGNPETDEFSQPASKSNFNIKGWWVDERGDLWQTVFGPPNQIRRFPYAGLDAKGNPMWDFGTMQVCEAPAPFAGKGGAPYRAEYFPDTDTLFISGYTTDVPVHGGHNIKLIGTSIAAYPNWSKGGRIAKWVNPLFDGSGKTNRGPTSMRVAGDFIFVGYDGGSYAPDSGFVRIFRTSDGGHVGRMWAGSNANGRIDITYGVSAIKRKSGEYLVLVEDDWYARLAFYRWQPMATPQAPVLTAKAGNTLAGLSWQVYPGTTHVAIARSEKSGGPFAVLNPASEGTSLLDDKLVNGATYFYRVTAGGAAGDVVSNTVAIKPSSTIPLRINAGGPQTGAWLGDLYNNGKHAFSTAETVDTAAPNAAPAAIYQDGRVGAFTYTISGQEPGRDHLVRLHFSENNGGLVHHRKMNVEINGVPVLTDFIIGIEAGNKTHVAVVKDLPGIKADGNGEIIIRFADAARFGALVNGIEIVPESR